MKISSNGIQIEFEDTGADGSQAARPAVLLVMGLGMQLVAWPPTLIRGLTDAGYRVIRFDNRDIGLSSKLDQLGRPTLWWTFLKLKLGWTVRPGYTIQDMANDGLGLLDGLGIERAHVIGLSMGGMIAQRMAISAPHRVRSLISIMSSSGDPHLPHASPEVLRVLMQRPDGRDLDAVVRHYLRLFQVIGSPGYPQSPEELAPNVRRHALRSFHPEGVSRQMLAVIADRSRAQELGTIRVPTLVLHGREDPLIPYACGVDTARRIPGARMVGIDGMGHDLPAAVVELLMAHLLPHLEHA